MSACASSLQRGEALYRQGDVGGALEVWRSVEPTSPEHDRVVARLQVVEGEFDRMLRRYQKRAEFFENEQRLALAVLYYRLTYNMDPAREDLLDKVQNLVRERERRQERETRELTQAVASKDLKRASVHAATLELLNPFDPSLQIEIRSVRASIGARVSEGISLGEQAYAAGDRRAARRAFRTVLELDPRNQAALGYLSYIRRFEALEEKERVPPPPRSISQEQILAEGHFRSATEAETDGESFWAITEYEAALSVDPNHVGARRALTALRTRLQPQVDELYQLGKRYFQEEDLHNALVAWRRVLSIDPTDQRTREQVQRAERMLARLEEMQTGRDGL